MQKVQSDFKRSGEQLKLKDQEIYRLKRKVLRSFFPLFSFSFGFTTIGFEIRIDQGVGD